MLNQALQSKLRKEYAANRTMRHKLIGDSNTALKSAKQAIFSLHRGDTKKARQTLDLLHKTFKKMQLGLLKKYPQLKLQGAYLAAVEEYVEAELFYQALNGKTIKPIAGLEIGAEQYIGGMSDMTGELSRQAVIKATAKDFKAVQKYTKVIEEVVGNLLQFDLVGHYRQKYDDSKRNLKRLESIMYDISLRE